MTFEKSVLSLQLETNFLIMYKAIDIAHKILKKATEDDNGELISNMKLQKLLYYEQGFHLAWFGAPLFEEDIEAWMYGPVVPSVFEAYKGNGKVGIEYDGEVVALESEEEDLFNEVYEVYSKYSAYGLMHMTHEEKPWKRTPVGKGSVISHKLMKSFFKTRIDK